MNERIYPLPTEKDYEAAVELHDQDMKRKGGAWTSVYADELLFLTSPSRRLEYRRAASLASVIEPTDENGKALDPMRSTTHAYKYGLLTGTKITDLVHDGRVDHLNMYEMIGEQLSFIEDIEDEDYEFNVMQKLVQMGNNGLEYAGEHANEAMERWEQDIVSVVRCRRMFRLGCGAMIYAAYEIHDFLNEDFVNKYTNSDKWSSDLNQFLAADTSE